MPDWVTINETGSRISMAKPPGAGLAPDKETEMKIRADLEAKWAKEREKEKKRKKGSKKQETLDGEEEEDYDQEGRGADAGRLV